MSKSTGAAGAADLKAGGSFELTGRLPVGEYVVYITPPDLGDRPPSEDPAADAPKPLQNVPEKYQSETTSDLRAMVKEGANPFTFDLMP